MKQMGFGLQKRCLFCVKRNEYFSIIYMNFRPQSQYFGACKSCTEVMLIPLRDPILLIDYLWGRRAAEYLPSNRSSRFLEGNKAKTCLALRTGAVTPFV
jgi:hypothetical protein